MTESGSNSHGFLDSIRQLGDGLLGSVHDRLELFSLELQEEKLRVIRILVLINAAIFCGFIAVIMLTMTVVYLFWATARLYVLGGFTILYAAAGIGIYVALRRHLTSQTPPFEATRNELKTDRASLRPPHRA